MNYRTLLTLLFSLSLSLILCGCGGDGEAAEGQQFWQAIVAHLLEVVIVVATPLVLLLVRKLIQVFEDKTKIAVAEMHEKMIDEWINKGIAFGHEQARKALKEGKEPMKGDEKKNAAVDFIAEGLKSTGLVTLGSDALAKLVESKLNMQRPPEDTEKPASQPSPPE